MLQWQGDTARDEIELQRITASAAVSANQIGRKSSDATTATLRVLAGDGALDRTAKMGEHYIYTAQRVQKKTVAGHALEIRSLVSAPVALEMRDVFPPRQPNGLEAVAGDHTIDLSWQPNSELDLAGYYVTRNESGALAILSETPLQAPAFQDKTGVPGHTYRYTVVAVDQAGNRSPPSESVAISVRTAVP